MPETEGSLGSCLSTLKCPPKLPKANEPRRKIACLNKLYLKWLFIQKIKSHKEIPTEVLLALKHSKPEKSSSQVLQSVEDLHSLNKLWFTQKINSISFAAQVRTACIFYRVLSHPPCKHGVSCRRQSLRQL